VIKLGVVPDETVEPGVGPAITGTGVGVTGVGVGSTGGVTAGSDGGAKVTLDTITCAVGAVGLEPAQAPTKSASRTNALMRVIPHARATAIPRRFIQPSHQGSRFNNPVARRSG